MRFLSDENFRGDIIKGILKKNPEVDIIRVQDTEIYQADDPTVLEWAPKEGRILLTHDVNTMPGYAYERVPQGLPMLGVFEVHEDAPTGLIIEQILMVVGASSFEEWENQVVFLPLNQNETL